MHPNPRVIIPIVVVAALAVVVYTFVTMRQEADVHSLTVSGTIEATEIHLGTQQGGEVKGVYVDKGDKVTKDEPLADVFNGGKAGSGGNASETSTDYQSSGM